MCVASSSSRSQSTALPIGRKIPEDELLGPQYTREAANPSPHLRALLRPASKPILLLEPLSSVPLGDADSGTGRSREEQLSWEGTLEWFQALTTLRLATQSHVDLLSSFFPHSSLSLGQGLAM